MNNENEILDNVVYLKMQNEEIKTKIDNLEIDGGSSSADSAKITSIKSTVESISSNCGDVKTLATGNSNKLTTVLSDLSSIKGSGQSSLTEISNKIDNLDVSGSEIDLTEVTTSIKGEDEIDLTNINDKLDNILSQIGNVTPAPTNFEADPYKLDETFLGYDSSVTYNDYDYIECTQSYTMHQNNNNPLFCLPALAIYCDDSTYNLKLTINFNCTQATTLTVDCKTAKINGGNTTFTESFASGDTIYSYTLNNIENISTGNSIFINFNKAINVISYKLEVFGKNVSILNKIKKFKVNCYNDDIIISKVENNNGYDLNLNKNTLNPSDLDKEYNLKVENVKDYCSLKTQYSFRNFQAPLFPCEYYITHDGCLFGKLAGKLEKYNTDSSVTINCEPVQLFSMYGNFRTLGVRDYNNYKLDIYTVTYNIESERLNSSFLSYYAGYGGNVAVVKDHYNTTDTGYFYLVVTRNNGINELLLAWSSSATKLNLGYGQNVTAYFADDTTNLIHVYMKVGDKMVRKTVTITLNESNVRTPAITEEKIIGTYDYYFETTDSKYFVVKNDELYVFDNNIS